LTSDGIDLTSSNDDPTRRLIRQVLGAVSEFEKRILVLKLRAARERKRNRGERVEGVKPYGHFPAEAAIVARMKQLHRKMAKGRRAP
jgi:DNA invertase Pin-like site-specific DNA recombinase